MTRGLAALLVWLPFSAWATNLYKGDRAELSLTIDAAYAAFRSDRSYAGATLEPGSRTWTEGYADVALTGSVAARADSRIYGSVGALSTATWVEGDAAGFTTGEERRTAVEDAYLGWRSGNLFAAFGHDGIDISFGRRNFMLGDGFLIDGDAVNFGKGFDELAAAGVAPGSFDRGGAYWLGRRHAFDRIARLEAGAGTKLSGTLFWIESDNKAQARTEIAGGDLRYDTDYGKFALAYIRGLSVDDKYAEFLGYTDRDGQDTANLRYDGSGWHPALTLRGELVTQDNGPAGDDWAGYAEVAWMFGETPWTPRAGARYSVFSDGFDPLFYGFSTGYGTWFQGEVAGNYAGPFNSNARITHLHLRGEPTPKLKIGALFYDFRTDDRDTTNLDGQELDLFVAWTLNDHVTLSPLLGFYKPERSVATGGSQLGDDDTNVYAQLVLLLSF